MHQALSVAAAVGALVLAGVAHAQRFTPQELDRMSQERLDSGDFRRFAAPSAPSTVTMRVPLHPAKGLWVCMSTDPYVRILVAPHPGAPAIGQSVGEVAAGQDRAGYTSVLFHEGRVGWIPTSSVHPYHNDFNARATCTVGGIRPNGVVTFDVR